MIVKKRKNKLYGCLYTGKYIFPRLKSLINKKTIPIKKNRGDDSLLYSPKKLIKFGGSELKGRKKTPSIKKILYVIFNEIT